MGKFLKGHVGYWKGKKKPQSEDTKRKISATLKGHTLSEDTKNKIGVSLKGRTIWNKGKAWPAEMKARISMTNKRKGIEPKIKYKEKGENAAHWKGGKTPESKRIRTSDEFQIWRMLVLVRDNYTCKKLGIKGGRLHCHHIFNFADYPELRFEVSNGITLSKKAHKEFHRCYGIKNNTKEQLEEFLGYPLIYSLKEQVCTL